MKKHPNSGVTACEATEEVARSRVRVGLIRDRAQSKRAADGHRIRSRQHNRAIAIDADCGIEAGRGDGCRSLRREGLGSIDAPPQTSRALDALRPGDTFAVWKLDRLARSLSDLLAKMDLITAKGAVFKSLTENIDLSTAGGKLMMQMLGVIAEFERNLTIERTTAGMARAREEGKQVGQPPALSDRQVTQAQKMRDKGKSVREIAAHFDVSHGTIYNWTNGPTRSRRNRK